METLIPYQVNILCNKMKDSILKYILLFCFILLCIVNSSVFAETKSELASESLPSLVSAIRITGPLNFCGEPVPLDRVEVREKLEKELLLMLWNRPQIILWLKRSSRYFPYIEKTLNQHNMPEDLKFIPVIESSMLSHAGSPKGALGYWQFIEETGRKYDLIIDRNIDERRNFFTSTNAAVAYLQDLYDLFGSWTLAATAYNLGEDRLQAEKTSQQVDNYYELFLPIETQRYIFRILAAKLILSNPSRYGFYLSPGDYYQPVTFDRVKISLPSITPLYLVAQASGTYFKQIKDLNPQIRGHDLLTGTYILAVPEGSGAAFHSRFGVLAEKWRQENKMHIYIVKKGDTLTTVAERFNVNLPALMAWNDLTQDKYIYPGEKLIIYQ
jgi:membrane-bound lytic murein transglycosylase D